MLDDKTGASSGGGTQHLTLAGAVLAELALLGRIQTEGDGAWSRSTKVVTTGDGPLPDPLLQNTFDAVVARPQDVYTLLATMGYKLSEPAVERLVQRACCAESASGSWGCFPRRACPPPSVRPRSPQPARSHHVR